LVHNPVRQAKSSSQELHGNALHAGTFARF
jgi:hypothetical protein